MITGVGNETTGASVGGKFVGAKVITARGAFVGDTVESGILVRTAFVGKELVGGTVVGGGFVGARVGTISRSSSAG